MGIVNDAVTSLIGTPSNFVGEIIFWVGAFALTAIVMMELWETLARIVTRKFK